MYSGGSGLSVDIHFVGFNHSFDVLSPLSIVQSKHFNHLYPYIEIATMISDFYLLHLQSIQWNAGMGNTVYPPFLFFFLFFSIPTSTIF